MQDVFDQDEGLTPAPAETTGLDAAPPDEYEEQRIGLGDRIEFPLGVPIYLVYDGEAQVDNDGELCAAFTFTTQADGEQVFAWQSYALIEGLKGASTGQKVRIIYKGDKELKGAGENGETLRTKQYRVALGGMEPKA